MKKQGTSRVFPMGKFTAQEDGHIIGVKADVIEPEARASLLKNGLSLNDLVFKVSNFSKRPQQCYNCYALGHNKRVCQQKTQTCPLCAETGHSETDCNANQTKCANCKGNHKAFDRHSLLVLQSEPKKI